MQAPPYKISPNSQAPHLQMLDNLLLLLSVLRKQKEETQKAMKTNANQYIIHERNYFTNTVL